MAAYAGNKSGNLTTVCRSALKLRERSERQNSVFPQASLPPESLEENGTETGAERARTPDHPRQHRPRGRASWGARPTRTPSPRSPVPRSLRKGPFPSSPPLPRAFIQSVFVGHLLRVRQVAEARDTVTSTHSHGPRPHGGGGDVTTSKAELPAARGPAARCRSRSSEHGGNSPHGASVLGREPRRK